MWGACGAIWQFPVCLCHHDLVVMLIRNHRDTKRRSISLPISMSISRLIPWPISRPISRPISWPGNRITTPLENHGGAGSTLAHNLCCVMRVSPPRVIFDFGRFRSEISPKSVQNRPKSSQIGKIYAKSAEIDPKSTEIFRDHLKSPEIDRIRPKSAPGKLIHPLGGIFVLVRVWG